jgi:hypothetical protein
VCALGGGSPFPVSFHVYVYRVVSVHCLTDVFRICAEFPWLIYDTANLSLLFFFVGFLEFCQLNWGFKRTNPVSLIFFIVFLFSSSLIFVLIFIISFLLLALDLSSYYRGCTDGRLDYWFETFSLFKCMCLML